MAKAQAYGRVLARFADAVHATDPQAKVISGGTAGPDLLFVRTALAPCASKVDIVAYHTYPGFGSNHMPEEADTADHAAVFREQIMHIPGIRNDLEFWLNEWNVSPRWKNSSDPVQARYVPRFYLYNLAQHVRGFMWTFVPGTDGNEDDLYGILHGETLGADAFQPRQAYRAFEVTSALFGQTVADPLAEFRVEGVPAQFDHGQLRSYAFRDQVSGKRIYAFWLAVVCDPQERFVPVAADLKLSDPGVREPILIDVRTGAVAPLRWKAKGVVPIPLKDSVMAVADASYLDWPEVPEAPGELRVTRLGGALRVQWAVYSEPSRVEIQRSVDYGPWQTVHEAEPGRTEFTEPLSAQDHITYRVRALGKNGPSPWSNPAWADLER